MISRLFAWAGDADELYAAQRQAEEGDTKDEKPMWAETGGNSKTLSRPLLSCRERTFPPLCGEGPASGQAAPFRPSRSVLHRPPRTPCGQAVTPTSPLSIVRHRLRWAGSLGGLERAERSQRAQGAAPLCRCARRCDEQAGREPAPPLRSSGCGGLARAATAGTQTAAGGGGGGRRGWISCRCNAATLQ